MAADLPEHYLKFYDAFQFIKDVAIDWDASEYLEAEPGQYITIARKEKNSERWFIGNSNGELARTSEIDLSFLDGSKIYLATIYRDGEHADYNRNTPPLEVTQTSTTYRFLRTKGRLWAALTHTRTGRYGHNAPSLRKLRKRWYTKKAIGIKTTAVYWAII